MATFPAFTGRGIIIAMISYEIFEKHILFLKRQSEYSKNVRNLLHEYSDVVMDAEMPIEQSWFQQIDLLELFLSDFNMTLEESLRSFVEWCVKEPEALKKWALAENRVCSIKGE